MIIAHGIGTRGDLPISREIFIANGALVVIASFVVLAGFWSRSRFRGNAAGRPVPRFVESVVDSPAFRTFARLVVLAAALFVLAVAAFGPTSINDNLAPHAFFITFWVGLVPASLLLGPVWRAVNPLRTIHAGWARIAGVSRDEGFKTLPDRWGYWPAAIALFAFVVFELVVPEPSDPFKVATFLLVYGIAQLVGAAIYGARWFGRADGFEVFSTLIGRMAIVGRRDDGRLVFRSPFNGLDGTPALPGLVAFVVVLLGSTAYDGIERTVWWQRNYAGSPWVGLLALVVVIAAVGGLYVAATRASEAIGGLRADGSATDLPRALAHSLIPIGVGYTVAHYFSLLVFDGQLVWILASDPFDTGANWFGTANNLVDDKVMSTGVVSAVRTGAIVLGHVLGTVAAHDRVLRLLPPERATKAQLPLLVLMVLFTMGGLFLILQ